MVVNSIQMTGTKQRGERTIKEYEGGKLSKIKVFKDINGDGKEDLYSVTTFPRCFCSDTHEVTAYDDNGDGLVDRVVQKDFSNLNGQKQLKREEETMLDKSNRININDVGKPVKTINPGNAVKFDIES